MAPWGFVGLVGGGEHVAVGLCAAEFDFFSVGFAFARFSFSSLDTQPLVQSASGRARAFVALRLFSTGVLSGAAFSDVYSSGYRAGGLPCDDAAYGASGLTAYSFVGHLDCFSCGLEFSDGVCCSGSDLDPFDALVSVFDPSLRCTYGK